MVPRAPPDGAPNDGREVAIGVSKQQASKQLSHLGNQGVAPFLPFG